MSDAPTTATSYRFTFFPRIRGWFPVLTPDLKSFLPGYIVHRAPSVDISEGPDGMVTRRFRWHLEDGRVIDMGNPPIATDDLALLINQDGDIRDIVMDEDGRAWQGAIGRPADALQDSDIDSSTTSSRSASPSTDTMVNQEAAEDLRRRFHTAVDVSPPAAVVSLPPLIELGDIQTLPLAPQGCYLCRLPFKDGHTSCEAAIADAKAAAAADTIDDDPLPAPEHATFNNDDLPATDGWDTATVDAWSTQSDNGWPAQPDNGWPAPDADATPWGYPTDEQSGPMAVDSSRPTSPHHTTPPPHLAISRRCWQCGKLGHIKKDCPERAYRRPRPQAGRAYRSRPTPLPAPSHFMQHRQETLLEFSRLQADARRAYIDAAECYRYWKDSFDWMAKRPLIDSRPVLEEDWKIRWESEYTGIY